MKPKTSRTSVVRKLMSGLGQGHSRAVVLPRSWLDHVERRTGKKVSHVRLTVTVDENLILEVLTIEPLFDVPPSMMKKIYSLLPNRQGDKP